MKAISIRNVPDNVYKALQQMAKQNRRSLQEQIKFILEQELKLSDRSFLARAAEWRRLLKAHKFSDIEKMVREDRER
jgi:plasmid stability protein